MSKEYRFEDGRIEIESRPRVIYWILLAIIIVLLSACNSNNTRSSTASYNSSYPYRGDTANSAGRRLHYARVTKENYDLAHENMLLRDYPRAIRHYSLGLLALIRYRQECKTSYCSARTLHLMNKTFAAGYQEMARAKYLIGKYRDSLSDFNYALQYDPDNERTHYYLGLVYAHRGEFHKVRREYRILKQQGSPLANRLRRYIKPGGHKLGRGEIHKA